MASPPRPWCPHSFSGCGSSSRRLCLPSSHSRRRLLLRCGPLGPPSAHPPSLRPPGLQQRRKPQQAGEQSHAWRRERSLRRATAPAAAATATTAPRGGGSGSAPAGGGAAARRCGAWRVVRQQGRGGWVGVAAGLGLQPGQAACTSCADDAATLEALSQCLPPVFPAVPQAGRHPGLCCSLGAPGGPACAGQPGGKHERRGSQPAPPAGPAGRQLWRHSPCAAW